MQFTAVSLVKGTLRDGKELCTMANKHCLWGCAAIFSILKDSSVKQKVPFFSGKCPDHLFLNFLNLPLL